MIEKSEPFFLQLIDEQIWYKLLKVNVPLFYTPKFFLNLFQFYSQLVTTHSKTRK